MSIFQEAFVSALIGRAIDTAFDNRSKPPSENRSTDHHIVSDRIGYLLQAHRITSPMLLSLVPSRWCWTIGTVCDLKKLVDSLQSEHIQWFADVWNVQRSWLEGADDRCSMPICGYKDLKTLGKTLSILGWANQELKMTILSRNYESGSRTLDRYLIVFSTPAFEGNSLCYKHALFEEQWNWHHPPCLLDTKAVARWFSMHLHHYGSIPIVPVSDKQFAGLTDGSLLPAEFVPNGPAGYDRFENRVLLPEESKLAIETEHKVSVIGHLEKSGFLASIAAVA